MASFGIIELISLLLGLAGFGLHPNPKPATVDAALEYAVVDPDIVVHIDAESLIPGNYKTLMDLPSQPGIKGSPDIANAIRQAIGEVEGARGLAKQATGIDFTQDVSDATAFVQLGRQDELNALVAVHGKFSTANVDKIAAMGNHKATPLGGGAWTEIDDKTAVAVTKDHVLLAGTTSWVRDRLADSWKAPPHAAGTNLGYAAALVDSKPVFGWSLTLSAGARQQLTHKLDGPAIVNDLITRQKASSFALYADGIGWTWTDTTKSGLEAMALASDGVVDLLRALQIAPRGMAKLGLSALESYKSDKRVAEMIAHKDDLMKIVASYTGDGNFKVKLDKDPAKLTLAVRLTGKTASEVVPLGAIVPFGALGFLLDKRSSSTSSPVMVTPAAPPPLVVPAHAPTPGGTGKRP